MPSKRLLLPLLALALLSVAPTRVAAKKSADVALTPEAVEERAAEVAEDAALMGKMFPMVSKLFVRKGTGIPFGQVFAAVNDLVDRREFALFATVGWGLVPVTRSVYEVYANVTGRGLIANDGDEEGAEMAAEDLGKRSRLRAAYDGMARTRGGDATAEVATLPPKMRPFEETMLFQIVNHIGQASKIGLSVIVVDCASLISRMMGYNPWRILDSASRIFSKTAYTGWIVYRVKVMKRFFLKRAFGGSDLGKLEVMDNLLDGVLATVYAFNVLNTLEVQTGIAVKSVFSVGATGTLVFGLASKDLATQVMSGLALHLSDKVYEGDDVRFSDGTSGKIERMGWFQTRLRNSDEVVVGIPNTQLSGQRVYNLSRTPRSQVKQELRVSYDDASKIPKLLELIKDEVQKDCPKLITDGSRPFRAHWRNYEDDHLQIVVDCHFTIKPTGNEYWDNRQKVLEAIYRAAKKTGVQFERLVRVVA